jgi:hypothetical protein
MFSSTKQTMVLPALVPSSYQETWDETRLVSPDAHEGAEMGRGVANHVSPVAGLAMRASASASVISALRPSMALWVGVAPGVVVSVALGAVAVGVGDAVVVGSEEHAASEMSTEIVATHAAARPNETPMMPSPLPQTV